MIRITRTRGQALFALLLTAILFSGCSKGDEEETPTPGVTKPYFIKFKANGEVKIFEEGNPGISSCGDCACMSLPPLNEDDQSSVSVCQPPNDWITAAHIESWNKKTLPFSESVYPSASIGYVKEGVSYYSGQAPDQTGSEMKITNVTLEGDTWGYKIYKVAGTFKCKVAKIDGSDVIAITEGEFVLRFTEDF
jgi:hypothetical protein